MTENFDNFIREILTEAKRCNGPSLRQLSDKPNYRWMRCAPNPYSPGYKRVYYSRRGKKINLKHCKTAVPGQGRFYECEDARIALVRRQKLKRKIELLKRINNKD